MILFKCDRSDGDSRYIIADNSLEAVKAYYNETGKYPDIVTLTADKVYKA